MKDVHIDAIATKVAEEFEIPPRVAKKLTRHMFKHIFKVMGTKKHRVLMIGSPLPQVYTQYDVKKMCNEMIDGDRLPWDRFLTKGIRHTNLRHINKPKYHLLE